MLSVVCLLLLLLADVEAASGGDDDDLPANEERMDWRNAEILAEFDGALQLLVYMRCCCAYL